MEIVAIVVSLWHMITSDTTSLWKAGRPQSWQGFQVLDQPSSGSWCAAQQLIRVARGWHPPPPPVRYRRAKRFHRAPPEG